MCGVQCCGSSGLTEHNRVLLFFDIGEKDKK